MNVSIININLPPKEDIDRYFSNSILYIAVIITFLVVLIVLSFGFLGKFPHWLDGTDILPTTNYPNYFRNLLEILYFIANSSLMAVAVVALIVAKRQSDHAQQQNLITAKYARAEVYNQFYKDFIGPIFQEGLNICRELVDDHLAYMQTDQELISLPEYSSKIIDKLDDNRFNKIILFLTLIENIGLLARREYISIDDIYYLAEGPLKEIWAVVSIYLEKEKLESRMLDGSEGGRQYEHSIWLLSKLMNYEPSEPLKA